MGSVHETKVRTRFEGVGSLVFGLTLALLLPVHVLQAQIRVDKWTTDNGLPQNFVTGVTTTPDGYIWFTTNEGLVRFDGIRFTVFNRSNTPEITSNRMSGAFADSSGTIWITTEEGQILRYDHGAFTVVMKAGAIGSGTPSAFFQDPAGHVMFYKADASDRRVNRHYRYHDGHFVSVAVDGITANSYLLLTDRDGGFWFGDGNALRRYKDGALTTVDLRRLGAGAPNRRAYQDREGHIWVGYTDLQQKHLLLRVKDGKIDGVRPIPAPVTNFAEDTRGHLWLSLWNHGVYRLDTSSAADPRAINPLEPVVLSDASNKIGVGYLCPAREGGMWVGTADGLLRLMPQTFRVFSRSDGLPEENVYPVYQDKAGRIWAGIWEHSLVQLADGAFKRSLNASFPASLFEDRRGRFWVGTIARLYYLDQGRLVDFTREAGFSSEAEFSVIAQDRQGHLWFGTSAGLSRYSGTHATVLTEKDGLPDDYVIAWLQGADGTVWVGTRGGLAAITNGTIRAFTTADGLRSNYIRSLYEDADRTLWIGTYDGGLTRFAGGRFTSFTMAQGLSSNGVFCILEDNRGWFWMNSNQGIFRVKRSNLNDFADGKTASLISIAYGTQDGLLNIEGNGGRQPAGFKARDGTLWFPTARGLAVVNPDLVVTNEVPPPVLIEDVVIDRSAVAGERLWSALRDGTRIVLAPGQNNLEIRYTGISFVNAAQVKFKYRLEGLDQDWNDIGSRRTAYYSYLPPGDYVFHVIAANRDGVWNTAGASVGIRVLPPFYRTAWFVALCAVACGVLLWAMHRIRVRQLAHEFDVKLEARVGERTRIARELHDTLLQSFHGLLLRFQATAHLLPGRPDEAKDALDSAIASAARAITEGRDAVQGLRESPVAGHDLPVAIRTMGEELATDAGGAQSPRFSVEMEGQPYDLHPVVRDEIFRIAAEALRNAFRHAHAAHIEVDIRYDVEGVRLRVRDDGIGIDASVLAGQGLDRHYGLRGMPERAALIGGEVAVWSEVGEGTELELRIPASSAYARPPKRRWWSRFVPAETSVTREGDAS